MWILHRVWFGTFFKDILFYCSELLKTSFGLSGTVSGGDWKRFTFFYGPTNLETCLPGFSELYWVQMYIQQTWKLACQVKFFNITLWYLTFKTPAYHLCTFAFSQPNWRVSCLTGVDINDGERNCDNENGMNLDNPCTCESFPIPEVPFQLIEYQILQLLSWTDTSANHSIINQEY